MIWYDMQISPHIIKHHDSCCRTIMKQSSEKSCKGTRHICFADMGSEVVMRSIRNVSRVGLGLPDFPAKNGGTPKWVVYQGKSHQIGWFRGTPGTPSLGNPRMTSRVIPLPAHPAVPLFRPPSKAKRYRASAASSEKKGRLRHVASALVLE